MRAWIVLLSLGWNLCCLVTSLAAADLDEILARGELRHIGVPYANFVTGDGAGLSVELIKMFAQYLGVRYVFVPSTWSNVLGDLSGRQVQADGEHAKISGKIPVRGDLVANGLTVLPWRREVVAFSLPIFPTQVWLIASAQSGLMPITPSGSVKADIDQVKRLLIGRTLLGVYNTCLDPRLYFGEGTAIMVRNFGGNPDELTPAIIRGEAETALLDVPDALVALSRWPGQFKVIGPISDQQWMAVAFAKDAPILREAFNSFFRKLWEDGTYYHLVAKYYPDVFDYYPEFFDLNRKVNGWPFRTKEMDVGAQ